ncbi:MAG: right-handed parallel beta-helix repeat-containing protein [Planctomycetes bacterium]|nr:right-handed parallel beta-helix repeat-containing protein [Planctomycetota bacterium]MCW8136542.1 right-handed parallel beta-helix repeat-containing protein [Planctomycetota bacterium]
MALAKWLGVLAVALCAGGLSAQNVFNVSNLNDSGAGSLRQAIMDANSTTNQVVSMVSVPDEIRFNSGVTGTITLLSALPQITDGISIIGPGRNLLTISGANTHRIFESTLGHYMGISRMTLANGRADGDGGAIYSRGWTWLSDVRIQNCTAKGADSGAGGGVAGRGGAVFHSPVIAELTIWNSIITGCSATGGNGGTGGGAGQGGAIYVATGSWGFTQLTVENCQATGGGGGTLTGGTGMGGAMYALAGGAALDSVFSNCTATAGSGFWQGSTQGGATYHEHNATFTNCTFSANQTTGYQARGGAVAAYAPSGTRSLIIVRSRIESNTAVCDPAGNVSGGGIFTTTFNQLHITDSWVKDNTAADTGTAPGDGGGIHTDASDFRLERSTVSGSTGGGLQLYDMSTGVIINSTVSGNTTNNSGFGGIALHDGVLQVSFSTITNNTGSTTGGIHRSGTSILTLIGSIIAGNSGVGAPDVNFNGAGTGTSTNCVIGVQDPDAIAVNGVNGNQVGTAGTPLDAVLGPLVNNGGRTPTHALLTGSPAINMGGTTGAPSVDQRQAPRDQGIPDAGSYEFGATPPNTGGQAGGEGDARCSTGGRGFNWLALIALLAAVTLAVRLRHA